MDENVIHEMRVTETEDGYRIEIKGDKEQLKQLGFMRRWFGSKHHHHGHRHRHGHHAEHGRHKGGGHKRRRRMRMRVMRRFADAEWSGAQGGAEPAESQVKHA